MKKKNGVLALIVAIILISQMIIPLTVFATESETTSITFNDKNLYKAIKNALNSKIKYKDTTKTIEISQSDLETVTELKLINSEIEDVTGLGAFTKLNRLELSGNNLTENSNLAELLKLKDIRLLDLSTNQINDISSIQKLYNEDKVILSSQSIEKIEIINIDSETAANYATITLPTIFNYINDTEIEIKDINSDVNSFAAANTDFDISTQKIQIDDATITSGGQLSITIKVKKGIFNGTEIKLIYIVTDDDNEGIMFKDKNLYSAIKEQLTKDQTVNTSLQEYTQTANLYQLAYDDIKVLVISKNDLNNKITVLQLQNKQIKELDGIEKFRALESVKLARNYITDVSKIKELQESKETLKNEIISNLEEMKTVLNEIKELQEEKNTLTQTIAGIWKDYMISCNQEVTDEDVEEKIETFNGATSSQVDVNNYKVASIRVSTEESAKTTLTNFKNILQELEEKNARESVKKVFEIYSSAIELISIVPQETMEYVSEENNIDKLTEEEIKTYISRLKSMVLEIYSNLSENLDNLVDIEANQFSDYNTQEKIEEGITEINNLNDSKQTASFLRNKLLYLISLQQNVNENFTFVPGADSEVQKLTIRLAECDTSKVKINPLNTLVLANNNISDTSIISQIKDLQVLYLSENLIFNIDDFAGSELEKTVKKLDLDNNTYLQDISPLQNFTKLRQLSVSGNDISDVSQLDYSKFTELVYLNLSNNKIDDLKNIVQQLKKISLDTTNSTRVNIGYQNIEINTTVSAENSMSEIELPKIFAQSEEYWPEYTSFSPNATLQEGTATILVNTENPGEYEKTVKIIDISSENNKGTPTDGTQVKIKYTVPTKVETITLDKTTINIIEGKTEKLTATITPENATNKKINWISSDENLVTIDEEGNIEAKTLPNGTNTATATITAKSEDQEKTATCTVTVNKLALSKIVEINVYPKRDYYIGDTFDGTGLELTVEYNDGTTARKTSGFTFDKTTFDTIGDSIPVKVTYTENNISKDITFNVKVQEKKSNQILLNGKEESGYTINTYLEKVAAGTSVNTLMSNLQTNATKLEVYNGENKVNDGNIATGMTLKATLGTETVQYIIIVDGDSNGDGLVDFKDILTMNKSRLNKIEIDEAYLKAGDVNRDGTIDFSDILLVNKYRLGKITTF